MVVTVEQLALGDTPNIAARLQGLAAPDTVISEATSRLVPGLLPAKLWERRISKGSTNLSRCIASRSGETDTARRRNPERLDTAGGARARGGLAPRTLGTSPRTAWGKSSS